MLAGLVAAGGTVAGSVRDADAITFRTVARTGQAAPGAGGNFTNVIGSAPSINAAGQTAFFGVSQSGLGIWSEGGGGGLAPIALQGSAAPGTAAGVLFFAPGPPIINAVGQTAFLNTLSGTGVFTNNDQSIWSQGGGSLALVAREGSPAPGTSLNFANGFSSNQFGPLVFGGGGHSAFRGSLGTTGVRTAAAAWRWSFVKATPLLERPWSLPALPIPLSMARGRSRSEASLPDRTTLAFGLRAAAA